MFAKATLFFLASSALLASASPVPDNTDSCNTDSMYCCNQMHEAQSSEARSIITGLGINLEGATGNVGLDCSPITAVGLGGGASCTQGPVCCSGNQFNGLVVIGCSPITVNL